MVRELLSSMLKIRKKDMWQLERWMLGQFQTIQVLSVFGPSFRGDGPRAWVAADRTQIAAKMPECMYVHVDLYAQRTPHTSTDLASGPQASARP